MNQVYISCVYVHESEYNSFVQDCLFNPTQESAENGQVFTKVCQVEEPDENDFGSYLFVLSADFVTDVQDWIEQYSTHGFTNVVDREIYGLLFIRYHMKSNP